MSKRAKLTPWYPARIKPVRVGVYEIWDNALRDSFYNHWSGKCWDSGGWREVEMSYAKRGMNPNLDPVHKWRGLARKP